MKRSILVAPDNVADGVNQLLLALDAEDAESLERSAARLAAFAELLRRLKSPPADTPPPVPPPSAEVAPGKAPPPAPRESPGEPPPKEVRRGPGGVMPRRALQLLRMLAAGPKASGEMARALGTINQNVDQPLRRSPWFEKEREGTSPACPTLWRLSPAGREVLRSLPPATSAGAEWRADDAGPPGGSPGTSGPSPTPAATAG